MNSVSLGDVSLIFIPYHEFFTSLKTRIDAVELTFRLTELYGKCFNLDFRETTFPQDSTPFIIFSILGTENDLYLNPHLVTGMAIVSAYEDYADIWSVCGSVNGQSLGHPRKIIKAIQDHITSTVTKIDLYIDYNNSYWNRAISLYTSLGFVDPINENKGRAGPLGSDYLRLRWIKDASFNKDWARMIANGLRVTHFTGLGYVVHKITISKEHLAILEKIAERQKREYGGAIGFKNNNSFNISDMKVGNYIRPYGTQAAVGGIRGYFCTFHTHPDQVSRITHIVTSPPSPADLLNAYHGAFSGMHKHYVFESRNLGGFWGIQVNPHILKILKTMSLAGLELLGDKISMTVQVTINKFFSELDRLRSILQNAPDFDVSVERNNFINAYLADINTLTPKSLDEFEDNRPIFQIDYYSWKYIDTLSTFEDWVITPPGEYGKFYSVGLLFGSLDALFTVMDAIDDAGTDDYHSCIQNHPFQTYEELVETKVCIDKWDGIDLLPVLKTINTYGFEEALRDIRLGAHYDPLYVPPTPVDED